MAGYSSYKRSKIDWLGDIPSHWDTIPLRYTALGKGCTFIDGDWIESKNISTEGIKYLTTGNVGPGYYKEQGSGYITEETFKELNCTDVFPGDLLISRLNEPIARTCIVPDLDTRIVTAVDNVIYRPNANICDKRYVCYWLNNAKLTEHANVIARGATMHRISRTMLGHLPVLLPPLDEQHAIADFSDIECAKIDTLISKQDRLVELLKEIKEVLIEKTVTRGLYPEVAFKHSNVEWIRTIPDNWGIMKLKFLGRCSHGLSYKPSDRCGDDGYLVLRASNIQDSKFAFDDNVYVSSIEDDLRIKKGDIVICSTNGSLNLVGKCAIAEEDMDRCVFGSFMLRYRSYSNPRFIYYVLAVVIPKHQGLYATTTINQLTMSMLNNMKIPVPPEKEQKEIVEYLDAECGKYDNAISNAKKEISLLQEYKQSLITEVVTGKRKVC